MANRRADGGVLVAIALLGAMKAQDREGAPPLSAAASSVARNPEAYYSKRVSLVGVVDQQLSPTAFSFDQDAGRPSDRSVLILTRRRNGRVAPNTYLTVIGRLVRFDSTDIMREARGYP